jgi:hypothetical protein
MSNSTEVSSTLACAIAEAKDLAGGLTWTPNDAASPGGTDAASTSRFTITQNGFAANDECTVACGYNYNECFLSTEYLAAYADGRSTEESGDPAAEGGAGPCPDATSVTVTCTYTSAGFCQ